MVLLVACGEDKEDSGLQRLVLRGAPQLSHIFAQSSGLGARYCTTLAKVAKPGECVEAGTTAFPIQATGRRVMRGLIGRMKRAAEGWEALFHCYHFFARGKRWLLSLLLNKLRCALSIVNKKIQLGLKQTLLSDQPERSEAYQSVTRNYERLRYLGRYNVMPQRFTS